MKKFERIGKIAAMVIVACLTVQTGQCAVKVAGVFGHGMVLQREIPVSVWGWGNTGEVVTVTFAGQTQNTTTDADGKWRLKLAPLEASSEGRDFVVNATTYTNVLVGEVWLCSGQSNMEWPVRNSIDAKAEIAAANFPMIRLVTTPRKHGPVPRKDLALTWVPCSPKSISGFSAVGFFFGRNLHTELNVPIGLINSSWGGTRVEPWTPPVGFRMVPELTNIAQQVDAMDPGSEAGKAANRKLVDDVKAWIPLAETAVADGQPLVKLPTKPGASTGHQSPSMIYNEKIHPLVPYALRGAIWYQGESNGGEGISYFHKKQALIKGWREIWGHDLSFYFVQLADFRDPNKAPAGGDGWAKLREAQLMTLGVPGTGMAVIDDIGLPKNIHPPNKQDVGHRLSLWALAKNYGQTDLVYSGPLYKSHTVISNEVHIKFDHVGSGLMAGVRKTGLEPTAEDPSGVLKHFAVASTNKVWAWADARIEGDAVIVSAATVVEPVAVRFAFATNPLGANLYNKEGLPASPFRTDDW